MHPRTGGKRPRIPGPKMIEYPNGTRAERGGRRQGAPRAGVPAAFTTMLRSQGPFVSRANGAPGGVLTKLKKLVLADGGPCRAKIFFEGVVVTDRHRLTNRCSHEVMDFRHRGFRNSGGLGRFDDGRVAEVFLNVVGKAGTGIETAARDSAIVASLALQFGVPAAVIRHALTRNTDGSASGPLGTLLDLLSDETTPR